MVYDYHVQNKFLLPTNLHKQHGLDNHDQNKLISIVSPHRIGCFVLTKIKINLYWIQIHVE